MIKLLLIIPILFTILNFAGLIYFIVLIFKDKESVEFHTGMLLVYLVNTYLFMFLILLLYNISF